MDLSQRPAVVANLTESANAPGAATASPTPASPTPATEATGRWGNLSRYSERAITHRGYRMIEGEEWDGDGFTTPEYYAWKAPLPGEERGDRLHLYHERFGFEPDEDWFREEVDRALARRDAEARAHTFEIGRDGLACIAALVTFCAGAWFVAVLA